MTPAPTKIGVSWPPVKIQTSFLVIIHAYISDKRAGAFEPSLIFVRDTYSMRKAREKLERICLHVHNTPTQSPHRPAFIPNDKLDVSKLIGDGVAAVLCIRYARLPHKPPYQAGDLQDT